MIPSKLNCDTGYLNWCNFYVLSICSLPIGCVNICINPFRPQPHNRCHNRVTNTSKLWLEKMCLTIKSEAVFQVNFETWTPSLSTVKMQWLRSTPSTYDHMLTPMTLANFCTIYVLLSMYVYNINSDFIRCMSIVMVYHAILLQNVRRVCIGAKCKWICTKSCLGKMVFAFAILTVYTMYVQCMFI
jgi:hypothetical protein